MPLLVVNSDPERLWGKKIIPPYLCFEFTDAGSGNQTLKFTSTSTLSTSDFESISYSTDDCETWTTVVNEGSSIEIEVQITEGLKIYWKGSANRLATATNSGKYSNFKFDVTDYVCNISGNIMSLLYGDDFEDKTEFPANSSYNFSGLFSQGSDVTAGTLSCENLILPATTLTYSCYAIMFSRSPIIASPELPAMTLASYCYNSMFSFCSALTTAPELPATTLETGCYNSMFNRCSSLNYIKMLATTNVTDSNLSTWTGGAAPSASGVSATGTFVKAAGVEISSGTSGIPSGWTVEEV